MFLKDEAKIASRVSGVKRGVLLLKSIYKFLKYLFLHISLLTTKTI